MTTYVALLRAVNVGGTGKLPMAELRSVVESTGAQAVRTYIASGNVVFSARGSAASVKRGLEAALAAHAGRPVAVLLRSADEMQAVLGRQPVPARRAEPRGGDLPRRPAPAGRARRGAAPT